MTVPTSAERAARAAATAAAAKRRSRAARPGGAEATAQLGFDLEPARPAAAAASSSSAPPPFAAGRMPSRKLTLPTSRDAPAPARARVVPPARPRPAAGPVGASTPVPPAVLAPPVPIAVPTARRPRTVRTGGDSLDALLTGAWKGLEAHGSVRCPVCRGAMTPRYAAGPKPVGGRCRDCGTTVA